MKSELISIIINVFARELKQILGEKLYAVYVFGAAAFPDAIPSRDIDFHVILKSEPTDDERTRLEELHKSLAQQFPPLGGEMDGYCILLEDALRKEPPRSQIWKCITDDSWALHCEHIRSGRHIILHGPDPRRIYPKPTWSMLEAALRGEFEYVAKHLREYPDYCILNLCRLIYSFETHDVVISKAQAAEWACKELPVWMRHVELAIKSYNNQATPDERLSLLAGVKPFLAFARNRIDLACRSNNYQK